MFLTEMTQVINVIGNCMVPGVSESMHKQDYSLALLQQEQKHQADLSFLNCSASLDHYQVYAFCFYFFKLYKIRVCIHANAIFLKYDREMKQHLKTHILLG